MSSLMNQLTGRTDLIDAFALYAGKDPATLMAEIAAMAAQRDQDEQHYNSTATNLDTTSAQEQTKALQEAQAAFEQALQQAQQALQLATEQATQARTQAVAEVSNHRECAKKAHGESKKLRRLAGLFAQ